MANGHEHEHILRPRPRKGIHTQATRTLSGGSDGQLGGVSESAPASGLTR